MNDGNTNDPSSPNSPDDPYAGVEGFEAPKTPEQDGHPLADNELDVNAFVDAIKLTFERLKETPIFVVLIGLSAISLLWALFSGSVQFIAMLTMGDLGSGAVRFLLSGLGILLFPLLVLVSVVQVTLFRPASRAVFEDGIDIDEPLALVKSTTDIVLPVGLTFVIVSIGTAIGLPCCLVPGLAIAFFFSQAPYLVAARDRGIVDAFKESANRAMEHWNVMAMAIGMNFVVVAMLGVVIGCGMAIGGALGSFGYLVDPVIQWVGTTIAVIIGLVISTAAFTTIDELQGLETIER